jgi:glutathione S-transferase
MITLHDYELSGECYKVRLLLALLGLSYRLVPVDIHPGADHLQPEFLDLNPLGEVPVLVDGDIVLTDVPAMLVWLAGRYDPGRRWLPEPAEALTWVTQWLGVSTRLAASAGVARMALARTEDVALEGLQAQAHRLLRVIDAHLWFAERRGEDWLLPRAHPTIADVACFPDLALCEEAGISRLDYPAIRRWLDRVRRIGGFTVMSGIFPASPGKPAAVS